MSEPKFTKGPWKFIRVQPEIDTFAIRTINDDTLAAVGVSPVSWREGKDIANAALIAAAPEMYNAEKDKIVHLQTLKNQICWLLAPKKDTVVTLDFVLKYIDEIIGDTENLLAKARGEGRMVQVQRA